MGYANTPFVLGFDNFSKQAVAAGVDAVLLVDIPPEEGHLCDPIFKQYGLDRILLLSPTSTDERIKLANTHASGFIYYVSLNGITGVGFGVKTPQQASEVAAFSDGVVVGSHFVGQIPAHAKDHQSMHSAINHAAQTMKAAIQA